MRTLLVLVLACLCATQNLRTSQKTLIEEQHAIIQSDDNQESENQQAEASLAVFKNDENPMVYVEESPTENTSNTQQQQIDSEFKQEESLEILKESDELNEAPIDSQKLVQSEKAEVYTSESENQISQTDVVLNVSAKTQSLSSSEQTKKHIYVYNPLAKKPFVGIRFPPMPVTKDSSYLGNSETLTVKLPPWSDISNHKGDDDLEFFQFIRPSDTVVNEY